VSSHCSPYFLPHFQRGSFPLPIPSAEFILSIPTHHPIRIKFPLDNHCILLFNLVRFYENLYFKKRIAFMGEKEIMTVKQVAEYLQMDEHTIYKLARSGQIPSLKIAGQWRFS
jgi:excisionase family DNA binding protein